METKQLKINKLVAQRNQHWGLAEDTVVHKLNEYMTCATIVQNSDPWQIANGNLELHQDVASKLLLYASSEEHVAAVNLVDTYSPR